MIGKFVKGRVCVFIDAANIYYSQRTLRWRLDYRKLKAYFGKECKLIGLYFYTSKIGDHAKQATFLKKLEQYGYKVKSKEVKVIRISKNTFERKGGPEEI